MTDRRPPKEAPPSSESEPDADGHAQGKRSQTVPLGSTGARGAAGAPRNTFSAQPTPEPPSDKPAAKRPAPNAWGATLLVGNAVPPPNAEPAHNAQPPTPAEPLRMPSTRPAPTPWQETRGQEQRVARTGTLLMPGAADPELQAAIAAARTAAQPGGANQAPSGTAARSAARSGHEREPQPQPRVDAQPAASAAPPPTRAATSAAPPPTRAATSSNRSEPLQLALDARDIVPNSEASMHTSVAPRRGPLIVTAIVGALLLVAALAWLTRRPPTASAPRPAPIDEARSSAVPAAPAAAVAPEPAAPPAAAPAAKAPPAAAPVVAQPAAAPREARPKPEPIADKPQKADKKKKSKKPSGKSNENIEDAREALKALASPPVVRVKRKADDDGEARSVDERAPPSPPSLPDPERE